MFCPFLGGATIKIIISIPGKRDLIAAAYFFKHTFRRCIILSKLIMNAQVIVAFNNKPAGFGKVDSAPDVRTDPALEGFQVVQQVLVRMRKLGLKI